MNRLFPALTVFCLFMLASNHTSAAQTNQPLLLAFYHPWYGTPTGSAGKWYKWDSFRFPERYNPERIKSDGRRDIASMDYPLLGPYDQGDRDVVRWHFRLAKAAGIDGFLCSWWKFRPSRSPWDQWQSDLFQNVLLPVAREENFKLGIIDECAHYVRSYDDLLWRITNSLPRFAAHPAYLKIDQQPVWFVYQVWDDWLSAAQASAFVAAAEKSVGDVFWIFDKLKAVAISEAPRVKFFVRPEWGAIDRIDCFGTYSYFGHWRDTEPDAIRQLYSGFVSDVRRYHKLAQLPILPGHDNTPVSENPGVRPRNHGALLETFIRAVDAARPDLVVVCSFNEWLETTQIEPSATWEDPYLYLKIIARWRGREWRQPPLPRTKEGGDAPKPGQP